MRGTAIHLLATLWLTASGMSAQESPPITSGQRVRVTVPEFGINRQVVAFEAMDRGMLIVTADSTMRYHLTSVTRLEAYAGRQSHPWRGAGIGFLAGYATGFLVWQVAVDGCYEGVSTTACAAVLGGGVGAIAGTLIGAFVGGFLWKTDKWEEVPLRGVHMYLMPRPDGVGIGASIEF